MKQNKADEKWKEKIITKTITEITDCLNGDVDIDAPKLWGTIDLAISKTEQHLLGTLVKPNIEMVFPSIICGKTHKPKIAKVSDGNLICLNCEYDFAMQKTAEAIFDEIDNMFSRCAYGTEKGIVTRMNLARYEKIKKKWVEPSLEKKPREEKGKDK